MPRMFLFAKHAAEEKIGVREQLWGVRLVRVGPRQHLELTIEHSAESIV